jgi:tetratricopeptide (TPR) repeat protein
MIRKSGFIAVLLALTLSAAWAQTQGRILGSVLDSAGNPLEKVAVSIVSQRTVSIHYELTTDKNGKFVQVGLMPGNYLINLKKEGFTPSSNEIHVSIDETAPFEARLKPADVATQKSLSEADQLFLKGNKLYAGGNFAEAAAAYEEAIKLDSGSWQYYLNLGLSWKKLNKPEDSLAAFKKAVELNPASPSANKEIGEALARAGSLAEAKPYYEKAVSLSPDDANARYNLGLCLSGNGEPEAAFAQFQKAVELQPDFTDAIYQLGLSCINLQKNEEAIAAFQSYLKIDPDSPRAVQVKAFLDFLKKK